MPMKAPQHGFTLLELLIVLCIIGILALSAYPSYRQAVLKTKRAEGNSALLRAMQQQEKYHTQHQRYAAYQETAPVKSLIWYSGSSAATSAYQISAAACAGHSLTQCVQLSATPGGALVDDNFSDPLCGILTLNSHGERSAAGHSLSSAPDVCR